MTALPAAAARCIGPESFAIINCARSSSAPVCLRLKVPQKLIAPRIAPLTR